MFLALSLSEKKAKSLISDKPNAEYVVDMDYIKGRACKMNVWREGDKLLIAGSWYDHTNTQLWELLNHVGIKKIPTVKEHGVACNCADCRVARGED